MKKRLLGVLLPLVLLLAILPIQVSAASEAPNIYVGGVKMANDSYLANGASATTTEKPTDTGYAHLTEGVNGYVLTLHNYEYTGVGHV